MTVFERYTHALIILKKEKKYILKVKHLCTHVLDQKNRIIYI